MDFEWDDEKNRVNITKHGVEFDLAALIFLGPIIEFEDARHDYGEDRITALGYIESECYVVIFTRREDVIRIISARRCGRRDRRRYDAHLAGGT